MRPSGAGTPIDTASGSEDTIVAGGSEKRGTASASHEGTLPVSEVQASIARFLSGESLEDRRIALPALEFESIDGEKLRRSAVDRRQ